jgi:hypothetical protein
MFPIEIAMNWGTQPYFLMFDGHPDCSLLGFDTALVMSFRQSKTFSSEQMVVGRCTTSTVKQYACSTMPWVRLQATSINDILSV